MMKVHNNRENEWGWIIRLDGEDFQVGCCNRRTRAFYPICSSNDYDRARLICEALKGFMPVRDFMVKGVH